MSIGTAVRIRTHGKVNLFLRVLGLRPDGFHEVETILQAVDLYDEIDISPRSAPGVAVDMRFAPDVVGDLPAADDNLIFHAAALLVAHRDPGQGADVRVVKGIPIGAGLGGGSGNAAGALIVLSELWDQTIDRNTLHRLAAEIGSDVAYCLDGGTALGTGRGEKLTQLAAPDEMWFVLGGSHRSLSTRAVYDAWDDMGGETDGPQSAAMTLALGARDIEEIASVLHNDLERAAFTLMPELAEKKEALLAAGALGASMSGSGPTLFGLASGEAHARAVAKRAGTDFHWVRVVRSRSDCVERLTP
ncbi:MAG TPA: 4-(cytidine 5'-diphospho)-2-C-methyl-D-erythritol kinase [Actinomycetota bacterium]|nr:4-(cytidine 5'-diphospho)-2-C-methyl-D-erythritol kinase [Actinomycetota bacterium]